MNLLQIALQQRGGPDRGTIAVVAWVVVDDRIDQRVDNPQRRWRPTAARGVEQAGQGIEVGALSEGVGPVVNGAWLDAEQFGDAPDGLPVVEPQQSLGPAELFGVVGMVQ